MKLRYGVPSDLASKVVSVDPVPDPVVDDDEGMPVAASDDNAGPVQGADIAKDSDTNAGGAQIVAANGSLKVNSIDTWTVKPEADLIRIGDGLGSLAIDTSPTDSRSMNFELRHRLAIQDYVTLGCIFVVFVWTIYLSCGYVYKMSDDNSPVLFYSDPSLIQPRVTCNTAELGNFMRAFNGVPAKVGANQ